MYMDMDTDTERDTEMDVDHPKFRYRTTVDLTPIAMSIAKVPN
jgi:hypothetical protein